MKANGKPERWIIAARLTRVSKKHRDRDDVINGIYTQDRRMAEWAESEGHEIVAVIADKNISGTVPPWERPKLGSWLTEPDKLIQYDGIASHAVDRLSRDYYDVGWLRKWAEDHGKKLYVEKERLRWPDDRDGIGWAFAAERAHDERLIITERVTRELDALRAAGKLVGRPPFGYTTTGEKYDRKLVPTDEGRKYVPLIFQKIIEGKSQYEVAEWLRAEGVKPLSGVWWVRTIGLLIKNPVYKGHRCARAFIPADEVERAPDGKPVRYRYGTSWVTYPHWVYGPTIHRCEALVDLTTWRRANDALAAGRPKRAPTDAGHRAMLAGALYCPNCDDSPMYRHHAPSPRKGGPRVPMFYYRCRGRGAKRASCGNMIRVEAVDAAVDEVITESFDEPVMEKRIKPGNEAEVLNRLEEIQFELDQLACRHLAWEQEDAERARLRAEHARVAATEIIPDSVELEETGDTYAELWQETPVHKRGAWLVEHGFRVCACKAEVTVAKGEKVVSISL